jgi:hypothetical protein
MSTVVVQGNDQQRLNHRPGAILGEDDNSARCDRDKIRVRNRQCPTVCQAHGERLERLPVQCLPDSLYIHTQRYAMG